MCYKTSSAILSCFQLICVFAKLSLISVICLSLMTQSLPGPESFQAIFSYKQLPPACNEHPEDFRLLSLSPFPVHSIEGPGLLAAKALLVWVSRCLKFYGNVSGVIPPLKKQNWWEQESHEVPLQTELMVTNTEHSYSSLPTATFPVSWKLAASPRGTRVWNALCQINVCIN